MMQQNRIASFSFGLLLLLVVASSNQLGALAADTRDSRPRDFRQPLRLRDNDNNNPNNRNKGLVIFRRRLDSDRDENQSKSHNNNNDPLSSYLEDHQDNGPGLLQTLGGLATALLPSPRRLSEVQKNRAEHDEALEQRRNELSKLWDKAPLPLRVVGNLVSPYLSRVVHDMATNVQDTQELVERCLQQAHTLLTKNPDVCELLGEPLLIAPSPFSEKVVVQGGRETEGGDDNNDNEDSNTPATTLVEMSFTVTGSKQAGVAFVKANSRDGMLLLRVTTVQGHQTVDVYSRSEC